MRVSAHDVARELRRRLPNAGTTVIHKLLYYAQGWYLVRTDEVLFGEGIEAWTNGPVVASLWRAEKHGEEVPPALGLDGDQIAVVEEVVRRYGHLNATQLVEQTHREAPWREAIAGDTPNPPIRRRALRAHFIAETAMDRVRERVRSARPLPTPDPTHHHTPEMLRGLTYDERVAVLQAAAVMDPDGLPAEVRARIDEDARRVAAGHTRVVS